MGEGIRSKTECICSQEMTGGIHTNPYCPHAEYNHKEKKLVGIYEYGEVFECIYCGTKSLYHDPKKYRQATEEEFEDIFI